MIVCFDRTTGVVWGASSSREFAVHAAWGAAAMANRREVKKFLVAMSCLCRPCLLVRWDEGRDTVKIADDGTVHRTDCAVAGL